MDIIGEAEKVGDYIINVVEGVEQQIKGDVEGKELSVNREN